MPDKKKKAQGLKCEANLHACSFKMISGGPAAQQW